MPDHSELRDFFERRAATASPIWSGDLPREGSSPIINKFGATCFLSDNGRYLFRLSEGESHNIEDATATWFVTKLIQAGDPNSGPEYTTGPMTARDWLRWLAKAKLNKVVRDP